MRNKPCNADYASQHGNKILVYYTPEYISFEFDFCFFSLVSELLQLFTKAMY